MELYLLLKERSDVPCNATVTVFPAEATAKKALLDFTKEFVELHRTERETVADAWESYYENDELAMAVTLPNGTEIYAHIEKHYVYQK